MYHPPKTKLKLSILLVASACSSMALANDDPSREKALEEVVVSGSGYRATGTKSELKPMDAPMSFEIYDNEILTSRQVDSVNEALRYVPGVTPESRPTVTIFDQYTIRGFESYRNYYDGLPLQYNGLWNLAPQVDAFATQSIEVLKGPTSVLYGSAPPGGMVNQTAKLPQSKQENLLRARIGTNNLRELALDSTGPLSENVDYRLIALTRSKDGQQTTTEEERNLIAPSLTWRISRDTKVNFNAYYQKDPDLIPSTTLPALGTLYEADYGKLDSDAYAGDKNWNKFEREVTMAGWKFEHNFNDDVTFLQNFRHTDGSSLQRNTYSRVGDLQADGRTLNRRAYFTDEAINGYVVDNQLAVKFNAGPTKHRLLVGAEYQKLDSSVVYGDAGVAGTPPINLAAPNYHLINPGTLPIDNYTEIHDIRQSQLGLYIQDEIQWGALTLLGGLRRDRYKSDDDVLAGAVESAKISQRENSGRIAAIYKFENGLAPYANYSESFEPTSGVDSLTNSAFKPTTAKQVEAGVKFKANNNRTELTAAYFNIKKQNVIINTADFNRYTQAGEVQSKGVELSWRQLLTDKVDVTLALADLDAKVTRNELNPALVGKTPIWVADKQASVWMNYYPTANLELSGGVRYVGKSPMDELNTDKVPAYTLVDVASSYRLNKNVRLGLTVSNLFDKRYVGACSDAVNCWMGAERSVELSLYTTF